MSKGAVQFIAELLITVIVGGALVLATFPGVGKTFDIAASQAIEYQTMEFSTAVNSFLGAPNGARHEYKLPDQQGPCISIYTSHVEMIIEQRKASADFLVVDGTVIDIKDPPLKVDCRAHRSVIMLKINNTVVFATP